jgi:aryl-alcohol dehydrogenase-like predicted oxidoreductase
MARGDRDNWGGSRATTRSDAKPRGPKPRGVRVDLGEMRMAELHALAAAEGVTPEALAARWLGQQIVVAWAVYERERDIGPEAPPAEWGGEVL